MLTDALVLMVSGNPTASKVRTSMLTDALVLMVLEMSSFSLGLI